MIHRRFSIFRRVPIFGLLTGLTLLGAQAENATNSPAPQFVQTAPEMFALGQVQIDKTRRSVTFPVKVNQRDGVIEYAIVHTKGKTHESLLTTTVEPQHIHVALLLLGVKAANTNSFPENLKLPPPGEAVTIEVSWKTAGQETRRRLEELVQERETKKPMARGPWIYNGSHIFEKTFIAQRDGSIVATRIDPDALVNNPRLGRENEELYGVNPDALPPEDAAVSVTIQLALIATPAKVP